mmetsp:Transcript_140176/g.349355  ORF Transcript_140176/g.349355 Transcript_140176/m.349355 type:complete len:409 (-) Transcript_140176:205-1431(-)
MIRAELRHLRSSLPRYVVTTSYAKCAENSCSSSDRLQHHGAGAATSVANGGSTEGGAAESQKVREVPDDPGSRCADGVAQCHRTAIDVDRGEVQVEELGVGEGDNGEGLVDLVKLHVFRFQACALNGLRHRQRRCGSEPLWRVGSVCEAANCCQGFDTSLAGLGSRHHNHCSSSVIQLGGIRRCDRPVLFEGRSQLTHAIKLAGAWLLVSFHRYGLASSCRDLHGNNLLLGKSQCILRESTLIGALCVGVLRRPVEAMFFGTQLRTTAHVLVTISIPQAVVNKAIKELGLPKSHAGAHGREVMRDIRHGLEATSKHDLSAAQRDCVSSKHDGLHAGGANLVDRSCWDGVRKPCEDDCLCCWRLAHTGSHDITKEGLVNKLAIILDAESGSLNRRSHGHGSQARGPKRR